MLLRKTYKILRLFSVSSRLSLYFQNIGCSSGKPIKILRLFQFPLGFHYICGYGKPRQKRDIRELSLEELREFFASRSLERTGADRCINGCGRRGFPVFSQMTSLSKTSGTNWKKEFYIGKSHRTANAAFIRRNDKNAVLLHDGPIVESVLIPADDPYHCLRVVAGGCASGCGEFAPRPVLNARAT